MTVLKITIYAFAAALILLIVSYVAGNRSYVSDLWKDKKMSFWQFIGFLLGGTQGHAIKLLLKLCMFFSGNTPKKTIKHNSHTISPVKDIATLFVFLVGAVFLTLFFRVNWFISIMLFFLPPAIWFSVKIHERVPHILFFVFEFVGFFVLPMDYIATVNHAWLVDSIFPLRILGIVPVEDVAWGVILTFLSIVSYEYFFEQKGHADIAGESREKQTIFMGSVFALFVILLAIGASFAISYAYAVLIIITSLVPLALFLIYYPQYLESFFVMGIYFSILAVAHEYVGLFLDHWLFPGEYLAWVNVGFASIPLEEFVFYFILAGPTVLAYYKFADDRDA